MALRERDDALPSLLLALHRFMRGLTYRLVVIEARTTEVRVELERRLKNTLAGVVQSVAHDEMIGVIL